MTEAREIAEIIRSPGVGVGQAEKLIEGYAAVVAARAVAENTAEIYDRIMVKLAQGQNAPLVQRSHLHDAERIPDVGSSA